MPSSEGNKDQSFLTAKEKWLIGIFIATAMTATVTFVVNLVLIAQLKSSVDKATAGNTQGSAAASTSHGWGTLFEEWKNLTIQNQKETKHLVQDLQNRITELENKPIQNKKETKDLVQDLQNRITELENKPIQNQKETKDLVQDLQNRITELENKPNHDQDLQDIHKRTLNLESKLEEVITKSDTRYDKLLAMEGWKKLSNGLHYVFHAWDSTITFATAEDYCKTKGARLASTGISNATIRSEMRTIFSKLARKNTWIGLATPYGSTSWFWSDGRLFTNEDMPWGDQYCTTTYSRNGRIYWGYPTETLSCQWSGTKSKNCICEI